MAKKDDDIDIRVTDFGLSKVNAPPHSLSKRFLGRRRRAVDEDTLWHSSVPCSRDSGKKRRKGCRYESLLTL